MYGGLKTLALGAAALLMTPQLLLYLLTSSKQIISQDVRHWASRLDYPSLPDACALLLLLAERREFRNVFYYRLRRGNLFPRILLPVFRVLYPEYPTLSISANKAIGPGLFIQHGACTVIAADAIGENCSVNQQVTIGYRSKTDCPTRGNNGRITAGAKVLGSVHIGDNVIVGANAVVVKDVPADCVVVSVPARIVRRNGVRVDEPLS